VNVSIPAADSISAAFFLRYMLISFAVADNAFILGLIRLTHIFLLMSEFEICSKLN
jgi:hypothetical protein